MARQMVKYGILSLHPKELLAKSTANTFKNNVITTVGNYKPNESSYSVILLKSNLATTGSNHYNYNYRRCK